MKEAVELRAEGKRLGAVTRFKDDRVGVLFKGNCYVTSTSQPTVYWLAQSWYDSLIPDLEIKRVI